MHQGKAQTLTFHSKEAICETHDTLLLLLLLLLLHF
jgi:hypothetical protein